MATAKEIGTNASVVKADWPTAKPNDAGIDAEALADLVQLIESAHGLDVQ